MIDGIIARFEIQTPEEIDEAVTGKMRLLITKPGATGFVVQEFSNEQTADTTLQEVNVTSPEGEIN